MPNAAKALSVAELAVYDRTNHADSIAELTKGKWAAFAADGERVGESEPRRCNSRRGRVATAGRIMHPAPAAIARRLLGQPNKALSSRDQFRFGAHGSVAVEVTGARAGTWFDHETQMGGGIRELIRIKVGISEAEIDAWIRKHFGAAPADDKPRRRVVATYDYSENGRLLYQVVRYEPKTFRQRRRGPQGEWLYNLKGVRRILYRLDELRASPRETRIYVVEGEKDADKLAVVGCVATCNSEGAGKWRAHFAAEFRDRDVVIIPDNDDAGRQHARAVAGNAAPVARSVRVLELPDLPPKGDVGDWLAAGGTREQLDTLAGAWPLYRGDDVVVDVLRPAQRTRNPSAQGGDRSSPAAADCLSLAQLDSQGEPRPNLVNAMLALRGDENLSRLFAYDEMLRAGILCSPVPGAAPEQRFEPRLVRDVDVAAVQEYLQLHGLEKLGRETTHQAVDLRAREVPFHPVQDYINSIAWDGEHRVDRWLTTYFGGRRQRISLCDRTDVAHRDGGPYLRAGVPSGLYARAGRTPGRDEIERLSCPWWRLVQRKPS